MKRRLLAFAIAFCMAISLLPMTAWATGSECNDPDCDHEAAIGDLHYSTLTYAINASVSGNTITLLKNIDNSVDATDYSGSVINYSLKAGTTLDGGGKTISGAIGVYIPAAGATVQNVNFKNIHNSNVVEKDTCEYYGWESKTGDQSAIYASGLTGTATITNCTFDNIDWDAIQVTPAANTAQIKIKDNVFQHTNNTDTQLRYVHIQYTDIETTADLIIGNLTITDNQFYKTRNTGDNILCSIGIWRIASDSNGNSVLLSGNYFDKGLIFELDALSILSLYPARSQENIDQDDLYPIAYDTTEGMNVYTSLQDAVDQTEKYVRLLKDDTDQTATIPAGKDIYFYSNGYSIGTLTNNGTLRIYGDSSKKIIKVINQGTMILDDDAATTYEVINNGTLNITDGSIYDLSRITNSGIVSITGGTFSSEPPSDWVARWHKVVSGTQEGEYEVTEMSLEEAAAAGASASSSTSKKSAVYYTRVSDGVNSTEKAGTYLLKDCTEDLVINTPTSKERTFYSNGHKFRGSITIQSGCGALSLSGNGFTLTNAVSERLYIGSWSKTANVIIENADLANLNIAARGDCTIQGGQYKNVIMDYYYNSSNKEYRAKLSITGGSFASGTVTVNYSNGNPSETVPLSNYVADGYMVITGTGAYPYQVVKAEANAAQVVPATPSVELPADLDGQYKAAAEAVKDALEESTDLVTGDGLTAAANTVANKNTVSVDAGTEALTAASINTSGKTVTIVIQPYMDVKIEDVDTTANTLTLDITPMYRTVATTADLSDGSASIVLSGTGQNAVEIPGYSGKLQISGTVTVTIPLPDAMGSQAVTSGSSKAYITHFKSDNGPIYVYEGEVTKDDNNNKYTLTFTNPNGFSKMIITSKSTVAVIGETPYDSLQAAINAAQDGTETTIKLVADAAGVIIPVGKNIVIDGQSQYTIKGQVKCNTSTTATDVTNLTLRNLTMDGQGTTNMAVVSQNQGTTESPLTSVNSLNLTMTGCTVKNYTGKGLYLTNAKTLTVTGCTFGENATDDMPTPNTFGDYTIDLNLCAIQGTVVKISNTTFEQSCGDKAVIKVAARGGESDAGATDIHVGTAVATVTSLTVTGCTFNNSDSVADINIGTDSKEPKKNDGTFTQNTTGAYAVTISNNKTPVEVFDASKTYKKDSKYYLATGDGNTMATNLVVPAYRTATKSADGTITVTPISTGTGSSSSGDYLVSVESSKNGTVTVSPSRADKGDTVTITVKPDAGYELDTLTVTDKDGDTVKVTYKSENKYTFTMPGSKVTIEATFAEISEDLPFTDVAESAWYYDAVQFVYENGLMTGVTTTTFGPNVTTSRAMLATILYRLEGEPSVGSSDFADVESGMYYTDAVAWASAKGIVTGYGDGTFLPNKAITREEMAAMLYRYASYKGYDVTNMKDLSGYSDAASVSSYAVEALQWATGAGLITYMGDGTLTPGGPAVRAQIATILMRFLGE